MKKAYVLVTAARNEEAYIERTIQSVIAQTILPKSWVIVSDGSTDRTDEIVDAFASKYGFIQFVRMERDNYRNFRSMVYAQKAGIDQLKGIEYEFLGMLDADISFDQDYYERVLKEFQRTPKLGIAGGVLFEAAGPRYVRQFSSPWSVSGPIQMFRRQCFEAIDYIPLKRGGQDAIAETMARMHEWEVKSFPELKVFHHRRTGTATANILIARYEQGLREFSYGNHPLYEVAKCCYRIFERPYILGSLLRLCGYLRLCLGKEKPELPHDLVKFQRREQMQRLLALSWWRKA